MHKNVFLCAATVAIMYAIGAYAIEYIYPLTHYIDNGQEILLFMHQTHNQETRLWSFNTTTNEYEQLLSSQYNPVGVQLLPDNSGFSFLDNGLIKVKKFLKRSPKTIEIYEPVYDFSVPQWYDDTHCVLHAKEGNRYGIYQVDLDGQLTTIAKSCSYDYFYPQKIGDTLFFIARDLAGYYYVKKIDLYATQSDSSINVQNFAQNSLLNLVMTSEREGFVIEHISTSDGLLTFNFYQLTCCDENVWRKKILFTFYVPMFLFFDKSSRLRDPMSAVFPRFSAGGIYFISSQENTKNFYLQNLHLNFYDMYTDSVTSCETYSFFPVPQNYLLGNYTHMLMPIMTQHGLLSGYVWE